MRRGLRIGEFQAGGADQDLRDGEYAVRNQLPCDGHGGSFLQPVLQESDNQECSGAKGQSRSEAHQGPCQRCHPGINKYGDEGDEHHDENGIGRLDLGRPDGPGTARERDGKRNHPAALGYPGFCHAKMSIVDDCMATCGTINLDYRSLYHHFENGCFMADCQAVVEIKNDLIRTMGECRDVTDQYCTGCSAYLRLGQLFMRLFAGLL